MKTLNFKILLIFALLGVFKTTALAQTFDKGRKLVKSFHLNQETEIRIINKYGNIHIVNWEKDSVRFEIELKVISNKASKVDKVFDNIDFDFTSTKYYIIAQTEFKNESSGLWQDISDFANIFFKGSTQAQIDYKVYLPASNNIDIQNKFGNVYTGNHTGDFKLSLSNGDFRANLIEYASFIELGFGKSTIKKLGTGRISISYGDIDISEAGKLNVMSKSSTLIIEKANKLDLESRRDKVYINQLNKLNGKSSFSYINIKSLSEEAIVNSNYGDLNIDKLGQDFQLVNFVSEYTEIKIGIAQNSGFDVEINYNHKTFVVLPQKMEPLGKKKVGEDENYVISGVLGSEAKPASLLKISIMAGSLQIFEN